MAIPTISAVSPALGHTGGELAVEITGTNFRLPDPPPAAGPVPVPEFSTMQVLFGTVQAREVSVFSSELAIARAPIHDPGIVDVVVKNLDDDGDPIVGEEATLAAAFTFARPDLSVKGVIEHVTKSLILELQRQVVAEVVHTWHTDWTDDPDDVVRITRIAKLPAIVVAGPSTPGNLFFRDNQRRKIRESAELVKVRRPPRTVDLVFVIGGVTEHDGQMLRLLEAVQNFFFRNGYLVVDRDFADPAAGTVRFEMTFDPGEDFSAGTEGNRSNVRDFAGTIVIRGVEIEGLQGFVDDMTIARTRELPEDPSISIEQT